MQRFRRSRSSSKKRTKEERPSRTSSSSTSRIISRTPSQTSTSTSTAATAQGEEGGSEYGIGMIRSTSQSSSLSLPEPEDFRTSLILPHLTARFELLRNPDGELIDFKTLTTHLDEQRKTGRLTTFEMDAVLQQYRLQAGLEANQHPLPLPITTTKKKKKDERIDWSGIDLEKLSQSTTLPCSNPPPPDPLLLSPNIINNNISCSKSSSSSSSSSSSPTSSRNSFVSFLPTTSSPLIIQNQTTLDRSPSSTSTLPPPPPNTQLYYIPRRNGGESSLFGSRIGVGTSSSSSIGMVKSLSGNSLLSVSSSSSVKSDNESGKNSKKRVVGGGKGSRRFLTTGSDHQSEEENENDNESNNEKIEKGKGKVLTEEIDFTTQREEKEEGLLSRRFSEKQKESLLPLPLEEEGVTEPRPLRGGPNLTKSQIKRISVALDSLPDELLLSKTLSSTGGLRGKKSRNNTDDLSEEEEEIEEEENLEARFRDSRDDFSQGERSTCSPTLSDKEPIAHSSSTRATRELEEASQTPLPPSSSSSESSSLNSHQSQSHLEPLEEEQVARSTLIHQPDHQSRHTSSSSSPPPPTPPTTTTTRERQYTSETDTTETPTTPNGTSGAYPKAFSFPFVPNRDHLFDNVDNEDKVGVKAENESEKKEEEEDQMIQARIGESKDEVEVVDNRFDDDDQDEVDQIFIASSTSARDGTDGDIVRLAASIPLPPNATEVLPPRSSITSADDVVDAKEEDQDEAIVEPRNSLFSITSSTGSSFHEAFETVPTSSSSSHLTTTTTHQDEDDDEIVLPSEEDLLSIRESKLLQELPPPLPKSTTMKERPPPSFEGIENTSSSSLLSRLDHLPSEELLAIVSNNRSETGTGNEIQVGVGVGVGTDGVPVPVSKEEDSDIGLRDLVIIQEALVRRAEEKTRRLEIGSSSSGTISRELKQEEDVNVADNHREEELAPRVQSDDEFEVEEEQEEEEEERVRDSDDEDDDEGDGSSSMGTGGMGSRKDSAESGITSTGAFDFGDELAGLGLTSLSPSSFNDSSNRASKRASKRSVFTNGTTSKIDTNMLGPSGNGPRSSRMELQTSQSSSSPGFGNNSVITPSTTQSDAFEFRSLAGSPDTASWVEQREEREEFAEEEREVEEEEQESFAPEFNVIRSPGMQDLSIERDQDVDVLDDSPRLEDDQGEEETQDQVAELAPTPENPTESTLSDPSTSLGAPVQLTDDAPSTLRVPRNMPRRDPASTQSMLIRDVRNQATLATFALKKTPTSPPSRSLTKKSIRKVSISSPHLVSAPADMATVPIVPSPILGSNNNDTSPSSKVSRSKSRKDGTEVEGSKSRGLGSRFKMLLKKQSRDHLSLNGDEVTPFVGRVSSEHVSSIPIAGPPPVTPPNQDTARFASTPGSRGSRGSEFPQTLTNDPATPLAQPRTSVRSPPRRPPPPSLDVVEELVEQQQQRISPPLPVDQRSIVPPSPVPSNLSGRESRGGLNRLVSRLRKSPVPPTSRQDVDVQDRTAISSPKTSVDGADSRISSRSREEEHQPAFGLGIENTASYSARDQASERSPSIDDDARFPPPVVARTAPLSVGRNSQASLAMQQGFSFPPDSSSSRGSASITRTSGHPVRASTDSMQRLWEAAEDLGLPPDKVQELVDSAYAQSPTTSPIRSGSGSMNSSFANSSNSPRRQRSNASHSRRGGSVSSHGRHTSETSSSIQGREHRRKGSTSSSRSLQDRVPTPPPGSRHHRKASLASSREAGPVPDRATSTYFPHSASAGSRLSVAGSQYPPPASPSLGSIISSRQSGYADSFLDFYAQASDDYDSEIPPVPPLSQQHASDRSLAATFEDDSANRTLQPRQDLEGDEEEHDEAGGEVVWQVLSDLRNNRLSTISKDSSFGFDSRDSSFEVDHDTSEGHNTSTDRAESIANMLRHRDRKRSSVTMPPFQAGRFPSIYVRDEQKLLDLGQHGGVASEQQGHFFVRPKDDSEETAPPLPDEYQQLIASASSRHAPPSQSQERDQF